MMPGSYLLYGGDGALKSLPLDGLPPEAWQVVQSGASAVGSNDVIALYKSAAWLYRAVEQRAAALSALPYVWVVDGVEQREPPRLPFEVARLPEMLNQIEGWLTLYGAAYLYKGMNATRRVKSVRALHPRTVKPLFDDQQGVIAYERGGERLTQDEVCRVWMPMREAEIGAGFAPAAAALAAAGVVRGANQLIDQLYAQGVLAPTIITVDGMPPSQELEKLESWVERSFAGIRNAFRTIALRAGIRVEPLGMVKLSDLAMVELTSSKREEIATAMGVPHSLLFSGAANYATAQQDVLTFYDTTVVPQARLIEGALNEGIFERYGVRLKFKPELLPAYQAREADKTTRTLALFKAGVLTRDEVRAALGYEETP
jgi:HK97 family phage portal protein